MHRLILLLFFCTMLITSSAAQTAAPIRCLDETIYEEQARIVLPEISEESPTEFRITAVSDDPLFPVVAVMTPEGDTFCNDGNDAATFYSVQGQDQQSGIAFAGAQEVAFDPGLNMAQIGAVDDQSGQFYVFIEGEFPIDDRRDHNFAFTVNVADSPPQALLFALGEETETTPALEIMPSGEPAEPLPTIEAQLTTDIEESSSAVGGEIPQEISLNVPYVEDGRYALVLIFNTGSDPAPAATVTETELGGLSLTCDGALIAENALELLLPDDDVAYTVTAVGVGDVDPVLATVDESGSGFCAQDSFAALNYSANLPEIDAPASELSAQVQVDDSRRIIAADQSSLGGEIVLLVEGATADAAGQTYQVRVTPGMLDSGGDLGIFAIALTTELDPLLAVDAEMSAVMGEEEAIVCDNAGERATCYSESPRLNDYGVVLADGVILRGYELDSALRLPLESLPDNTSLPVSIRAQQETSGGYVLVLHLVTD